MELVILLLFQRSPCHRRLRRRRKSARHARRTRGSGAARSGWRPLWLASRPRQQQLEHQQLQHLTAPRRRRSRRPGLSRSTRPWTSRRQRPTPARAPADTRLQSVMLSFRGRLRLNSSARLRRTCPEHAGGARREGCSVLAVRGRRRVNRACRESDADEGRGRVGMLPLRAPHTPPHTHIPPRPHMHTAHPPPLHSGVVTGVHAVSLG